MIEAADVDEIYDKAKERKIKIVYSISVELWGVRHFFVLGSEVPLSTF